MADDWPPTSQLLSREQARRLLQVSRPTFDSLIADGGPLKATQIGTRWKVWLADLRAYMNVPEDVELWPGEFKLRGVRDAV